MGVVTTPAFGGANFDGNGGCLRHPDVRLMQKMFTGEGKVVYKELMRRCPKCSIKQQQQQLQENKAVTAAMASECASSNDNPLTRSSSRSRSRARSKSREREPVTPKSPPQSRSASKPRQSVWGQVPTQRDNIIISKKGGAGGEGSITTRDSNSYNIPTKKVFDSPFDTKGRCHYHPNISLAKKKLTGGWKVLLDACPKCVEERYIQESNNSDNRSVGSRRSTKSDNRSVSSRHSTRSDSSRHSNKSNHRSSAASSSRYASSSSGAVQSPSAPRSGGGKKNTNSVEKTTMARYECPFDNQGCCRIHHHVRLAKKKLTGGWKVIQDMCPECDEEDNCSVDSRNSRFSRRSVASRGSQKSDAKNCNRSSSSNKSKSAIRRGSKPSVRRSTSSQLQEGGARKDNEYSDQMRTKLEKMHITTEDNREDGFRRVKLGGEWNEGTRVQGKASREKATKNDKKDKEKQSSKSSCTDDISSSNASAAYRESKKNDDFSDKEVNDTTTPKQRSPMENKAHYRQRALKDYKDLYESAKVVKNMLFVDVHGDAGRYTGDVNEFRMPHGQGNIIYEHGLVQGGKWTNGVMDEGSMASGGKSISERKTSLSNNRVGVRSIDP